MAHFVSSTSKGLAEVTSTTKPTVQFIHESVRDFLVKDEGIRKVWPQYTLGRDFEALSHDRLKACCAFYLNVGIETCMSRRLSSEEQRAIAARRSGSRRLMARELAERIESRFPFLRYASLNMFPHANATGSTVSQAGFIKEVDMGCWISAHNLFLDDLDNIYTMGASRAYIFAANNWVDLLHLELRSGSDIWSPKELFSHPLIVASAHGHEASVKILLATDGVESQPRDASGRTPLGCAISNNHEAVVDILLEMYGVGTTLTAHRGQSLLKLAQRLNRWSILKRLVGHDCRLRWSAFRHHAVTIVEIAASGFDVEELLSAGDAILALQNYRGNNPIQVAIEKNEMEIIKTLVQLRGAVGGVESWTTFAVRYAASNAKVDVMKYLLAVEGVDVNSEDEDTGQSAISLAAENKHDGIVALLVSTNRLDARSALIASKYAAWRGKGRLLESILSPDNININIKGKGEITLVALSEAIEHQNDSIVTQIISTQQLDVIAILRASAYAASRGKIDMMKRILSATLHVDTRESVVRTALAAAMRFEQVAIVTLLVDTERVNVTWSDSTVQKHLSWAKKRENGHILPRLVQAGSINLDVQSLAGSTLLLWAAARGFLELVSLLIPLRNDHINLRDAEGRTPLSRAAGGGHISVVLLLSECPGIEIDSRDFSGRTPLSWAAGNAQGVVVTFLGEHAGVDVNSRDMAGRTPLSWTAGNGCNTVAIQLSKSPGVELDLKDLAGRTPLSWAAASRCSDLFAFAGAPHRMRTGFEYSNIPGQIHWVLGNASREAVDRRGGSRRIDVNSRDLTGRTPLSWAATYGTLECLSQLLGTKGIDVNLPDEGGRTPLAWIFMGLWLDSMEILLKVKELVTTGAANVNTQDDKGRTPLIWAVIDGQVEVVRYLLGVKGIQTEIRDSQGRTARDWARGEVKHLFKNHSMPSR